MEGKITELKVQKRNKQRVNVYLDGRFAFGLAAIEAARLKVGQHLSADDVARLEERDAVEVAQERAMGLLSYRPRSQGELRRRLKDKGHEEETIEQVLERLTRAGLVNDLEFAHYWIENRFQFNPRGVRALRQELWQKGIDDATIDEALVDFDEEEAAARATQKALRRLRRLDPETFRRRLNDYLRRRGFPYPIIKQLVDQSVAEHAAEDPLGEQEG
jgi:regulatory protein